MDGIQDYLLRLGAELLEECVIHMVNNRKRQLRAKPFIEAKYRVLKSVPLNGEDAELARIAQLKKAVDG